MTKMMIGLCAATLLAMPVAASTPGEWDAMDRRTNGACIAMSGLSRPVLLAQRISFSDTIGTEIRMLRGRDSRGRTKRLLCAVNRATGRTEVQEAGNWYGPTMTP